MSSSDRKTILITGATDGLGKLVAKQVAQGKMNVLIHYEHQYGTTGLGLYSFHC